MALGQTAIAINVVSGKYLIEHIPVHVYLCARYIVSCVFLYMFMVLLKTPFIEKNAQDRVLHRHDWLMLGLQAFTGGFLFNILFFWGMGSTSAISAGIISSALPAILAICAFFCLGEKIKKWNWVGIVLAMFGILVINLSDAHQTSGFGSFWGNFLVLLAMIPEAMYSIFNKFTSKRITTLGAAMIVNIATMLMLLPFAIYEYQTMGLGHGTPWDWCLLVATGFSNLFFFWFWAKGLIHIPASTAAIFTSVLPVATTFMAWVFLKEIMASWDFVGMFLVITSIFIGTGWLPGLFKKKQSTNVVI